MSSLGPYPVGREHLEKLRALPMDLRAEMGGGAK